MFLRLAPLLLVSLTLGCFGLAKGEGESQDRFPGSNAKAASSSLVIIATVTPVPAQGAASLSQSNSLAALKPTATPVQTEDAGSGAGSSTPEGPAATETLTSGPESSPTPSETATPAETATPTATATATATPTPPTPTIVPLPGMSSPETQVFVDHNAIRDRLGLPRFRTNDTLMAIARERARIMASIGNMTHYNPDGSTVFGMMSARGYGYITGSENIHFNWGYSEHQSITVAVEAWIDSPSHYASMVNPSLGRIGIGIAKAADGTYYYSVVFSD